MSSGEQSPPRNNTPEVFNSAELSAAPAKVIITISSVPWLEPQIDKIDSDSNDPTIPPWLWKTTTNTSFEPERSQFTSQPFQCPGNSGSGTTQGGSTKQQGELRIKCARGNPIHLNTVDDNQHCRHLRNIFGRKHILTGRVLKNSTYTYPLPTSVTHKGEREDEPGKVLSKISIVSQHIRETCVQMLPEGGSNARPSRDYLKINKSKGFYVFGIH